jgi:hypothetical protein
MVQRRPSVQSIINLALYHREVCLEWAQLPATPPAHAKKMLRLAEDWEKFASNIRRDAEAIASSHRVLSEADKLLRTVLIGPMPPTPRPE